MKHSKAIVTLAIGEEYAQRWQRWCQPNWQTYADRHGYDLICFEQPLDDSARARQRSPAWQKCLILSQPAIQQYERVVWVDADILMHPDAPSIVKGVPVEKIGAVDEYATPSPELHPKVIPRLARIFGTQRILSIFPESAHQFYAARGLAPTFSEVIQTGVMVLSPEHHRPILERAYYAHEQTDEADRLYEMPALSFEILKSGCVHWLDPKFNILWLHFQALYYPFLLLSQSGSIFAEEGIKGALAQSYFLHFGGLHDALELVDVNAIPEQIESMPMVASPKPALTKSPWQCQTPVALFLFNKPDATWGVFDQIRKARPPKLFVITQAPLTAQPDADTQALSARALVERVDWDCDVLINDAEANAGSKPRVDNGLNWVFDSVEEAIILRADCIPHSNFFRFCDELLARYRDEERVMSISGSNLKLRSKRDGDGYYFSRYPLTWGWATWRRAWRHYDPHLQEWQHQRNTRWLQDFLQDSNATRYWSSLFQKNSTNLVNWYYAWMFACWTRDGLCIHPNITLVSNLGLDAEESLWNEGLEFPLSHPPTLVRDAAADVFIEETLFSGALRRKMALMRDPHKRFG
jgi:hypothetical protein